MKNKEYFTFSFSASVSDIPLWPIPGRPIPSLKQFNEEGVDAHIYIQGFGKGRCVPILLAVWQIENHGRLGIVGQTCYLCDDFREEAERGMDQVHSLQACLQWSTSSTKALSPACYHFTTTTSNYQSSNQLTMSWGSTLPHVRLY